MRTFFDFKDRKIYEVLTKNVSCTKCMGFEDRMCPNYKDLMHFCHTKNGWGYYSYKYPIELLEKHKKKRW